MEKQIVLSEKIQSATIAVREDHTLALTVQLPESVAFSLVDGATLLSDEQDGDTRVLRIALKPQSYGVIEWDVK